MQGTYESLSTIKEHVNSKRTAEKKREADSVDGEGCFKSLLWAMGERQKVSIYNIIFSLEISSHDRAWLP